MLVCGFVPPVAVLDHGVQQLLEDVIGLFVSSDAAHGHDVGVACAEWTGSGNKTSRQPRRAFVLLYHDYQPPAQRPSLVRLADPHVHGQDHGHVVFVLTGMWEHKLSAETGLNPSQSKPTQRNSWRRRGLAAAALTLCNS